MEHKVKRIFLGVVILILALGVPGCSAWDTYAPARETLKQNRTKWESRHITHYRMSLGLPWSSDNVDRMPLVVEVKDNRVISVVDARGQTVSAAFDPDTEFYYPDLFSVPGLFSYATQEFDKQPPSVDVSYDPLLGYPTLISVDPYVEPCCEEYDVTVEKLQILPP